MANETVARPRVGKAASRLGAKPTPSLRFDALVAVMGAWFLGGVYLDGWAHQHVPDLETFFTPWHAVLYSGFLAMAVVIVARGAQNYLRGYSLANVMPAGYGLSLAGIALFMTGAVGDLIWHTLFGIEANVEALLSPTHLLLALGSILASTGPLRAAWGRRKMSGGTASYLPMLLSTLYMFSVLTFFTQYAHPFGQTYAAENYSATRSFASQALGIVGVLLQAGILMGFVLLLVRRFRLPFGSMTLLIGVNNALMVLMRSNAVSDDSVVTGPLPLIAVGVLSGIIADVLLAWLRPSVERAGAFRVFSFAVPFVLYALYFTALALFGGGIAWKIHLWAGAIVLSGVVGLLLSYAFVSPATPALE